MKSAIILFVLFWSCLPGRAQRQVVAVGNTAALTIKSGTIFSADSLVLIPGSDFTLTSNTISVSPVPVNIPPMPGIDRVYYLSSPVIFSGAIQVYYQPSELNGNPESTMLYTDSLNPGSWLAELSSSVNTSLHYVQFAASGQPFSGATASGPVTVLAISLISFTGNWYQPMPAIQWIVNQNNEVVNFDIESSADGRNWRQIGELAGSSANGTFIYSYTDAAPSGNMMYYRIRLLQVSGNSTYSNIIKLDKSASDDQMHLAVSGEDVTVYFTGLFPTAIRLVNVLGQTLRTDMTSRQKYDLDGLRPGVYFLQYLINGKWTVREFGVY